MIHGQEIIIGLFTIRSSISFQWCTNPGQLIFSMVAPNICEYFSMEFVSCHSAGTYSFKVAPGFCKNLYTPVLFMI